LGFIGYTVVKTYEEAIELLKTGKVEKASLDHDLGTEKTGYDVICWMEENNVWPRNGVIVHSQNPVGKQKMEVVVKKHYGRIFR
jgi:hypothetical protein